jgi:hypothetical protein
VLSVQLLIRAIHTLTMPQAGDLGDSASKGSPCIDLRIFATETGGVAEATLLSRH